jgi:hypothetical protein
VDRERAGKDAAAVLDHLRQPFWSARKSGNRVPLCVVFGGGSAWPGDLHDPFEQSAFATQREIDRLW